jgi:cellulose synthase/poly-beta-1,6-N-acetylglucosamine synthase-like glycosyltransferase
MGTDITLWIFWLSLAFLVYTLAGYQALLWVISKFRRRSHLREEVCPSVSVIVVAHNEAGTIGEKILNTLSLEYPKEKLEVLVGSDGSTDGTAEIIRSFANQGVRLVERKERLGKHHIQMLALDESRGEIVAFTDASIRVEPPVLRKMVAHFADPGVGCVCSVDQIFEPRKGWKGEHFYVSGEMGLRLLETKVGSLVSLSGALFAVRRKVCKGWHPDMSSDFFLALHAVEQGYRAVIDPECRARLGMVKSQKAELTRKVRTIVHGLVVFFAHLHLLNFFRYGIFSWQLASHKLFRWLLPLGFAAALISNALLWKAGVFYQVFLILQLVGYLAGLLSTVGGALGRMAVFKLAGFIVMGNVATVIAWWKFSRGDKLAVWQPSQRG